MSMFGSLNDWLAGNPQGTADEASSSLAAAEQRAKAASESQLEAGLITQQQFDQTQEAIYSGSAPNSLGAAVGEVDSGISGAAEAATDPAQVLKTGAEWEGRVVGNVAGAAANAAGAGFQAALKKFFSNLAPSTWVILIILVALYWYFGGITRRARKVFS